MRLRSDEQLLVAFRTGSEAAFAAIHDRYRQRLLAYARQMLGGSRQDAEDVLQDVFLRAYATLRGDGRAVALRPWLYRVAHNRCVDHIRRPAPPPVEIGEDTPWECPSPSVPDPIESAQRREELARLVIDIRRLPEQQRSALLMREIDGMSYGELAGALQVSVPAVKSLLVRARMGLAEAGEARDAACEDIRADLADSHDRGVRISGHARRHLRDCDGCTRFRAALRATSAAMGALVPGAPGPLAALAQAIGLGGAGSGAVAGGGGLSAAVSAGGAMKVAALVGTAAIAAGGAGTVGERLGGGPAGGKHGEREPTERAQGGDATVGSPGKPLAAGADERAGRMPAAAVAAAEAPAGRPSRGEGAARRIRPARRENDRPRAGKRVSRPRVTPAPPAPAPLSPPAGLVPAVIGGLLGDSQEESSSSEPTSPRSGSDPAGGGGAQDTDPAGTARGEGGASPPKTPRSGAASDGGGQASP